MLGRPCIRKTRPVNSTLNYLDRVDIGRLKRVALVRDLGGEGNTLQAIVSKADRETRIFYSNLVLAYGTKKIDFWFFA